MCEKVSCHWLSGAAVKHYDRCHVYVASVTDLLSLVLSPPPYLPHFPIVLFSPFQHTLVSCSHFSFLRFPPCSLTPSFALLLPPPPLLHPRLCFCSWMTGASQWHSWSGCCVASLQGWSTCQTWTTFTETSPPGISWSTATWSARSLTLACRAFWTTLPLTPHTQARWSVLFVLTLFAHSVHV